MEHVGAKGKVTGDGAFWFGFGVSVAEVAAAHRQWWLVSVKEREGAQNVSELFNAQTVSVGNKCINVGTQLTMMRVYEFERLSISLITLPAKCLCLLLASLARFEITAISVKLRAG